VWIAAHFIYVLPYDYLASMGAALAAYLVIGAMEPKPKAEALKAEG